MSIIDRLKDNHIISIIIICSIVISASVTTTTWFYERKMDNINSKFEAEIAQLEVKYESKISKFKANIIRIKSEYEAKIKSLELKKNTPYKDKEEQLINSNVDKTDMPLITENFKQKSCEVLNPQPGKDIRWNETNFKIEGAAENIDSVWVIVKPSDESRKACSLIKIKVNENNLWEGTVKLIVSKNQREQSYNVFIFPDNIYNKNYFNEILKQRSVSQSLIDLPYGEPNDYCHSITVKRINNEN